MWRFCNSLSGKWVWLKTLLPIFPSFTTSENYYCLLTTALSLTSSFIKLSTTCRGTPDKKLWARSVTLRARYALYISICKAECIRAPGRLRPRSHRTNISRDQGKTKESWHGANLVYSKSRCQLCQEEVLLSMELWETGSSCFGCRIRMVVQSI